MEEHGSAVVQLTMWLYKRQRQYADFMQHVQAVIISVLGNEREERERRVKTQAYVLGYDTSKEAKVSCSLPNAKNAAYDAIKLGLAPPISGLHKHQNHKKRYENIHLFLTQREWISRAEDINEGGMTWLELMVLYDTQGYQKGDEESYANMDGQRRATARNKDKEKRFRLRLA